MIPTPDEVKRKLGLAGWISDSISIDEKKGSHGGQFLIWTSDGKIALEMLRKYSALDPEHGMTGLEIKMLLGLDQISGQSQPDFPQRN